MNTDKKQEEKMPNQRIVAEKSLWVMVVASIVEFATCIMASVFP